MRKHDDETNRLGKDTIAMNNLPTTAAQFPVALPRLAGVAHATDATYVTLSVFLVLFGLIWCCLVLFGPKIYFCSLT